MKRIIDGLSYNKMNVLHWHLTDTQSFPFVSTREPLMSIYGAYTPQQVYRPEEVKELVHYATVRGVKIVPEFDGRLHFIKKYTFQVLINYLFKFFRPCAYRCRMGVGTRTRPR